MRDVRNGEDGGTRLRPVSVGATALLALVMAAGCGGDKEASVSAPKSAAPALPQPPPAAIRPAPAKRAPDVVPDASGEAETAAKPKPAVAPEIEAKQRALLDKIAKERRAIRQRPSSCAARNRRERAFDALYQLHEAHFDLDRVATDRRYRTLDDYVFAELTYAKAKTCCWNKTTPAMWEVAMGYNRSRVSHVPHGACAAPFVFKAHAGGYETFRRHAAHLGRSDDWARWAADEDCPQERRLLDEEAPHGWTPFCRIADEVLANSGVEPSEQPPLPDPKEPAQEQPEPPAEPPAAVVSADEQCLKLVGQLYELMKAVQPITRAAWANTWQHERCIRAAPELRRCWLAAKAPSDVTGCDLRHPSPAVEVSPCERIAAKVFIAERARPDGSAGLSWADFGETARGKLVSLCEAAKPKLRACLELHWEWPQLSGCGRGVAAAFAS